MSSVSKNGLENNVSAKGQLKELIPYKIFRRGGKTKILFVGNSITWHAPLEKIKWQGDWGMAASSEDKDYVHKTVAFLDEKYGTVDFAIAQVAEWESRTPDASEYLRETYGKILDFAADVIVIRVGENIPKDAAPACKNYFADMVSYFVNRTNAIVVVTDSFWRNDARDDMVRQIAEENGYVFCKLSDLENDERTMALGLFEHRGVSLHPSDYGMEMIAKRIFETIKEVL